MAGIAERFGARAASTLTTGYLWKRSARGGQSDTSDYLLVDRQGKVYSQAELRPRTALPHGHTAGTPRQRAGNRVRPLFCAAKVRLRPN
eukprot:scaffold64882_cov75-Phaeocystis_antarctica.AAC.1